MFTTKPNLNLEKQLWLKGFENIVGLDEAGKGAWAGPLVAAAVILPRGLDVVKFGVNDSKKLSPNQRERVFLKLIKNIFTWSVGIVEPAYIDREGILSANRQAMFKAISKLKLNPHYLLVDGVKFFDHHLPYQFIIKGDGKSASIAAASVIAKVIRDHLMSHVLHRRYVDHNFAQHKGYGTRLHEELLNKHGLSEIHRRSFQPMVGNNF